MDGTAANPPSSKLLPPNPVSPPKLASGKPLGSVNDGALVCFLTSNKEGSDAGYFKINIYTTFLPLDLPPAICVNETDGTDCFNNKFLLFSCGVSSLPPLQKMNLNQS